MASKSIALVLHFILGFWAFEALSCAENNFDLHFSHHLLMNGDVKIQISSTYNIGNYLPLGSDYLCVIIRKFLTQTIRNRKMEPNNCLCIGVPHQGISTYILCFVFTSALEAGLKLSLAFYYNYNIILVSTAFHLVSSVKMHSQKWIEEIFVVTRRY